MAEFDELFAAAVRDPYRAAPTRLRVILDPAVEEQARDLTARESECCSFFAFTLTTTPGALTIDVAVPPSQVAVLDGLAARVLAARRAR